MPDLLFILVFPIPRLKYQVLGSCCYKDFNLLSSSLSDVEINGCRGVLLRGEGGRPLILVLPEVTPLG